jgi:sulfide:quinone oxidoreductase
VPDTLTTDGPAPPPLDVLIAGAGVAGLEAAFALRAMAGDRVAITLLSAADSFTYRPRAIGEPFTAGHAEHYPLAPLLEAAGVTLRPAELASVDPVAQLAHTTGGDTLLYDALFVAVGARLRRAFPHATLLDDARVDELLHGLVQDIEGGYVRRLAVVVPAPVPWPLPAYELALMASERAWDMQTELDVTILTPERYPLEAFGPAIGRQLADMLTGRRITVLTSAHCEIPRQGLIVAHPRGVSVAADRIVALPHLRGPALGGLPCDRGGFIPVDQRGAVRGVSRVWAAGDATDTPVKQGGVGAHLADRAAAAIAELAGLAPAPAPGPMAVEGLLLTGGTPRYLRYRAPDSDGSGPGESIFQEVHGAFRPPKIAARYLGPHLAELGRPGRYAPA